MTVEQDFNYGTTENRPLLNMRDEPLSSLPTLRRMHLINTDAHVSPWATAMTFGTTSLVLRAIEQGKKDELRLDEPTDYSYSLARLAVAGALDTDLSLTGVFEGGARYTMLDIQKKIIEIVEKVDYTDEEAWMLEEWKQAVSDQERDIMLLDGRSDAITKLGLIQDEMARSGADWASQKVEGIDKIYGYVAVIKRDDIAHTPVDAQLIHAKSTAHMLRNRKFARYMPDAHEVNRRVTEPPTTTRAAIRGHLIKNYKVSGADWNKVGIGGDTPQFITMHPYDTTIHATYGTNARKAV